MKPSELLDDCEKTRKIDAYGMLTTVLSWPEMLLQALERFKKVKKPEAKPYRQMVISGMGGSAVAGDIFCALFSGQIAMPIVVNRDYRIPAFVNNETLFFALSYSGNTEETLSALKEAEKHAANIVCITAGGRLKEIAEKKNYPLYLLPSGFQPRAALPFILTAVLLAGEKAGLIADPTDALKEAANQVEGKREAYAAEKSLRQNPVKQVAKKLVGKMPLIFAANGLTAAAALRLKTQFNENSKLTALLCLFPELNHNEMVNLAALKCGEHNFCLLCLRDENEPERIKKRIEITKSLLGGKLGGVHEVWAEGKTPLARILSLIYFSDLLSVYTAIVRGMDPSPVEVITRLKKEMAR